MRNQLLGRVLQLSCAAALLGCGVDVDEVEQPEQPESVGTVEQALLGAVTTVGCTSAEDAYFQRLFSYGRILARSSASLECVIESSVNGLGQYGPYEYCANVHDGDPLEGESLTFQAARIASAAVSRLDTEVRCNQSCPGGRACANDISVGDNQYIKWTPFGGPPPTDDPGDDDNADMRFDVSLAWHEVSHNLGYEHDSSTETCPHSNADVNAPNIFGECVKRVSTRAAASPVCASMACAPGERALPKRFELNGPTDPCECVPDVFVNENEAGDRFGNAFATGDFDADGYDDLAVGTPRENSSRGVVYVFRGSAYGPRFWKRLRQQDFQVVDYVTGTTPFTPTNVSGDEFGYSLGAGDFNGDGYADLLVGTPGKNTDSGGVYILPGSSLGPDIAHGQWIDSQDSGEALFIDTRFAQSIAVGNFDADAYKDFAIGVPNWTAASVARTGAVAVHRGRAMAIGAGRFQVSDGLRDEATGGGYSRGAEDNFGWAVAAGNIDGDARDELVVGAPERNSGNGQVFILEKDASTWTITDSIARPATGFGEMLAVADFISDGVGDIAVGAPHDLNSKGSVFAYRGSSCCVHYTQTLTGVSDEDYFGAGLTIGHVAGSSKGDLVVGVPNRLNTVLGRLGAVYYYTGVTGTTLGAATFASNMLPNGGWDDVVVPTDLGGGWMGDPVALLRLPGVSARAIVAGAVLNVVGGVESGAAYIFRNGTAAWKLDQVTMRHGTSFPY
jgi:hypothetical protein